MRSLTTFSFLVAFLLLSNKGLVAQPPRFVFVYVQDEQGKPIDGVTVEARYMQIVQQDGQEFPVPTELAKSQTTEKGGRCKLTLTTSDWSLAGLHAHRPGLTSEEISKLYDNAPSDPDELKAFEKEVNDRSRQFRAAYQLLSPDAESGALIKLKLQKAINISGQLKVDGRPLPKAFVEIHSRKDDLSQLFAHSSPELTDDQGRFDFYATPGDLDQAKIVVERPAGNHVLTVSDVQSKPTPSGLVFNFETAAKDYISSRKP
ncbi:hypothetical protein [Stieleria varia]|uniref:Nickel uptake substrate-specific transmembrane region n=1 Tax=Stieleria varia TaxID=2528005 RepID=A0A5C6A4T5_9BACT|nr:hypothetical protein [Stieleria varia]TWT94489.1 hypothetical protein Pla52n_53100 [Stieleria varia]